MTRLNLPADLQSDALKPGRKTDSGIREDLLHPDPLLDCLVELTRIHGRPSTRAALSAGLPLAREGLTPSLFARAAAHAGFSAKVVRRPLAKIDQALLPVILLLNDNQACVLQGWNEAGEAQLLLPDSGQGAVCLSRDELLARYTGIAIFSRPHFRFDQRTPPLVAVPQRHWFWGTILEQRPIFKDILASALLINLLGLAMPLFTMNVYDRVVPNFAVETLWVFSGGIVIVMLMDYTVRLLRGHFVDLASSRIDLKLSGMIMERVLGMRLAHRPASVGAFAANLRSFETVRDFIASATVTTLIDLPFALLFLIVLAWISWPLVFIPLLGIIIVIIYSYLIQYKMRALSETTFRAAALRNAGDVIDPRTPVPWIPAAVLIALGGGAALLPAIGGLPIFGFASMALILGGGIAGMPWLARTLLAPLSRRPGGRVPLDLAIRHLHGAPGQAATALCGIVASTALMIAMAVMVTSFRGAVDSWLGQILSDDLYLRVDGGTGLDPAAQANLRAVPGVAHIAFSRQIPLTLAADRPPVTLIARPVATRGADATLALLETAPTLLADTTPIWLSEPAARLYGWKLGEAVRLPIAGRYAVAGIWRDYARQQGAIVIRDTDYARVTGDLSRTEAAITLASGADPQRVERALTAAAPRPLAGLVSIARPATLRRYALELFDRSFAVTYLLEGVAILVGLAGVAATMSAQTIARTREFGMLRHIGVGKGQIVAMLASEGALLGLVGGVAGIALGGVMAQVLVHVINPQSFNWTMATRIPWGIVGSVAVALVIAAAGTATLAGRRAIAADAVRMVREDW